MQLYQPGKHRKSDVDKCLFLNFIICFSTVGSPLSFAALSSSPKGRALGKPGNFLRQNLSVCCADSSPSRRAKNVTGKPLPLTLKDSLRPEGDVAKATEGGQGGRERSERTERASPLPSLPSQSPTNQTSQSRIRSTAPLRRGAFGKEVSFRGI